MTFDASEMEVLHDFFRIEAHEHLEAMTAALLGLEKEGGPDLLDELLRKTHTLKGSAAMVGLRTVAEAAHNLEEAFGELKERTAAPAAFDALMGAVDIVREMVDDGDAPLLAARLAEKIAQAQAAPPAATAPERRQTDRRLDAHVLRVDVARLDELMDGVGELVFDRTRIERRVAELRNAARELGRARTGLRALIPEVAEGLATRLRALEEEFAAQVVHMTRVAASLIDDTEALRRTTTTLQAGLTRVRMAPVRWLFQRLARPLRDIERSEGKRVDVVTAGEEVELDKAVVERITDALIHMLRNAIAHGIEAPEVRTARGKPPEGTIFLSARHQGESVFLEVADDGAGIDVARIRAALVAAGRPGAAALGEAEVIEAIFDPGVSAREEADQLAGRGVGLDVVRDAIVRLGGEIAVTSTAGEGTRFVIRIPFTTAITPAFLFKVSGQVYAVSSVHVVEQAPAPPPDLPLVSLHRVLGLGGDDAGRGAVLVMDFGGRRFAMTCDKTIGVREIVVKSLGPLLAPLGLYAGATISGAGKVQLILDPAVLARIAYPAAEAPAPQSEPAAPAVAERPPRVLVCDDSRTVREAIARMLANVGYVVDQAADGEEAWTMLAEVSYDLLVSDMEMPRLSGAELLARVRGRHPGLPVVAISARAGRDRASGADAFLAKPVARQELVARVAELLRRG
jgi:chemosensory pili system protein ChpA (sensor histidine kinase/response regulator)